MGSEMDHIDVLSALKAQAQPHMQSKSMYRPPITPPPEEVLKDTLHSAGNPYFRPSISGASVVAVIGVGYIGLHLVQAFGRDFPIIAYDISASRLKDVEASIESLESVTLTCAPQALTDATHILISVPTLLNADGSIDTSYLESAIATVRAHCRAGCTVVIESSVAVGMTRKLLAPLILEKGIKAGMSPERVDPGRISPPPHTIPKIISGLDDLSPGSLSSIQTLYEQSFQTVVPVSSPEVAEMCKLYENCQRMINIAYATELVQACAALSISHQQVLAAAATKEFGYTPFAPSLGVGGHCIPVNPHYLFSTSAAHFPLLQHATDVMAQRPAQIADAIFDRVAASTRLSIATHRHPASKARILVVGMGYKRGQGVLSHSPGVALLHRLAERGAEVEWLDPLVHQRQLPDLKMMDLARWGRSELASWDCVVMAVRQVGVDLEVAEEWEERGGMVEWC